jgi:hypothetical protein
VCQGVQAFGQDDQVRGDAGGRGQALVGVGDDPLYGLRAEAAAVLGGQAGGACGETGDGDTRTPFGGFQEISTDWYQR